MHTTASSLVAIAQYFWRIRTSVLYCNQQTFNIDGKRLSADLIRDSIRIQIVAAYSIRFERKFPIRRSLVNSCLNCGFYIYKYKYK